MTHGRHTHPVMLSVLTVLSLSLTGITQAQEDRPMGTAHTVLSDKGSTRATGYSMSCKIIRTEERLFAAWLDHVAEIRVAALDTASGQWSEPVLVGRGTDNHSGPAITMDSQGYLTIVFGPHHGPFQVRHSMSPRDVTRWGPVEQVGLHGTYPSLVCGPDDTLYLTYRGGPMPRRLMFQKKPARGNWSDPMELVDADVPGGYTQYGNALAIEPDGTLHLGFHIYDLHPAGGKAAGYVRSRDGGNTWETAEGTRVSLPITPETPCFFAQDDDVDMRVSNIAIDPSGTPFLMTSQLKQRPVGATLWHHDGTAWRARDLLPVVRSSWPDKAVGMHGTLTFDETGTLYVALVTGSTPGGGWGHPSWNVAGLISHDGGTHFRCAELASPQVETPNWLSSIERPYNHRLLKSPPAIMYTEGGPGEGCTGGPATRVHFLQFVDK